MYYTPWLGIAPIKAESDKARDQQAVLEHAVTLNVTRTQRHAYFNCVLRAALRVRYERTTRRTARTDVLRAHFARNCVQHRYSQYVRTTLRVLQHFV